MQPDEYAMKVVGRKGSPKVNVETANGFLKMIAAVRGNRPFMSKGVWRFKPSRRPSVETQDDHSSLEPRLANTDDLVSLCRFLNEAGANYIVIPFAIRNCCGKPNKPTTRRTPSTGRFSRNY